MVWKILSALSAVCLGTACYFAWTNQKLLVEERKRETLAKGNLDSLKAHIVKANEAKKGHETRLAMAKQELEATKTSQVETAAKVTAAEQELSAVKVNLEQTTKVVNQAQKQIEEAGDIEKLIAQIEVLKKERAEAEGALANQNQHLAAAQEKVTSLTNAAKEAEEREARGRRGIVDDNFTAKVAHSYTDWGFVVLNKGNGGGVFANADLEVKRGKEVVAKLKVRDVEQNSSVADLVKGSLAEGEHIRAGDLVVAAAEQSAKVATPKTPAAGAAAAGGAATPPAGTPPAAGAPAAAMGSDPFGGPAPAPAPATPAMGSDPFGGPAPAPAGTPPAATPPAMGADPFGTPPATPPAGGATPPAGGATPPSTADPFGTAPPAK